MAKRPTVYMTDERYRYLDERFDSLSGGVAEAIDLLRERETADE